ncbi:MAG: ATP-dependent DNA helicase RecG [Anaeromyxobacter sp.]|nr:ATP-dependent DNA helicase RecG [Anaeromyxobacter sp.]
MALVPPLRFAVKDGFAGLARLAGFGETVRGAVARARALGAADTPALRALAAEGEAFDGRAPAARRLAVGRLAVHLASLVQVPEEIAVVARAARAELLGGKPAKPGAAAGSSGAPSPRPSPPLRGGEGATPRARPTVPAPPLPSGERAGVRGTSSTTSGSAPPLPSGERAGVRGGSPPAPDEDLPEAATPRPPPPEPRTPEERAARRAALACPLAAVPRAHASPRGLLEERGRATVEQALEFWPRAWQDRTTLRRIRDLQVGDEAIVLASVKSARSRRTRNGRVLLEVAVADETGGLGLVFFNAPPWKEKQLPPGATLLVSGKVTEGFGGRRQMTQPEVEVHQPGDSANFGRIVPIYPGPADWQHPALRKLMKRLCDELAPLAVDDLPAPVRARRGLLARAQALRQAHFPPPGTDLAAAAARATPAFRRLVFEELFFLQLAVALQRRGVKSKAGISFEAGPEALDRALARLPFALTGSQQKVLGEIARDMASPEPMNRLLQGDVGSGKTAVAFAAMLLAVQSGYQAVLMAPTEILAEQHARTLSRWLAGTTLEVALVGNAARGKGQQAARQLVRSGAARLVVGTHALLEAEVGFDRLGLVVVDEQHRFGVLQRAALIGKGRLPDVLVMTATPIPRTLALAFYGDLDQSKITELPPGRTPVETRLFGDSQRKKVHELARQELGLGRQVYVVYPLVAESEKSDLADATSGAEALRGVFAPHAVGLLHGKMKPEEKQSVMEAFRRGEVQVLVATTVIEVGVDVPNASVMIVEHAERFGLSQLHQLRGRVGRGAARSRCLLLARLRQAGPEARERLEALVATQDGFELARVDLKLRGPGEMLGTRQSGQALLEVADLYRDEAILEEAREEAFALVEADPSLASPEHAAAAEALRGRWASRLSLAQVG